jgi:lipopolysaccharide O-acetyltransferase
MPRRIEGAAHVHIGRDVVVQRGGWLGAYARWNQQRFTPGIHIGDGCRIGSRVLITAIESVHLGAGCLLSEDVFISDHAHGTAPSAIPPTRQDLVPGGPVHIGRHCFIGIRACVMPGVRLGDHCVVGAHSVVTRSFPAGSVIAGAPARLIRRLDVPTGTSSSENV